ncbi:MAG: dosT [Marmoricola sp.]|nr:dosT [Marmoricola sp.]
MTSVNERIRISAPALPHEELSTTTGALMGAIMAISSDLDLHSVLTRLVDAAVDLTGAGYGALGVIGSDGTLAELITTGLDDEERTRIAGLITHPVTETLLDVPIRIRDAVFGNLYLTEKPGGRHFTHQDQVLVETLAKAAGLVIENARAYGLSERRRHWLEASAELADALQPPITIETALDEIAQRSRAAARAFASAVVQFPAGDHPVISAHDGPPGTDVTEIVRSVIDEARVADTQAVALAVELGDRHALVLPLRAHLADPGVLLMVFDRPLGSAGLDEREFLAAFADQAGLAVDRAQAFSDRDQHAVVSERARIARDLHDVVIQRLFAAGLRLEGFRKAPVLSDVEATLGGVVSDLDLTIRDIRSTIFGLQQHTHGLLRSEVSALLDEYTAVLGFAPALRTHGPLDLLVGQHVTEQLMAVLREGLSNVARHARATDVVVEIAASNDEVVLRVIDGGIGIPEHRTESGLKNARDRAILVGGVLDVTPNVGPGTTLTWRAPLT